MSWVRVSCSVVWMSHDKKKRWPSSLGPCSPKYCYITDVSKVEGEKLVCHVAQDFVNHELGEGSSWSLLGFLSHLHSDVVPAPTLWGHPWAAHPSSLLSWPVANAGHQVPAPWVLSTRTPKGGPVSYWDFWHGTWLFLSRIPSPTRPWVRSGPLPLTLLLKAVRPDQTLGVATGSELLRRRGVKSWWPFKNTQHSPSLQNESCLFTVRIQCNCFDGKGQQFISFQ